MIDPGQLRGFIGAPVTDEDGYPIGTLATYWSHPVTGEPVWAGIKRLGPDDLVQFASLTRGELLDGVIRLNVSVAAVDDAPVVDPAADFTDDHASLLSAYYGLHGSTGESSADSFTTDAATPAGWIVRSEEQLRVSTRRVPTERLRVRKVIVTEEKTVTVTIRREEFQLTREPLDSAASDIDLAGDDDRGARVEGGIDLVLHEERVVVSTQVVPVERLHISVERVAGLVDVTGEVRQERIDITRDAP
jgi:uncharacterized protein (TIGR02271 family)